MKFVFAVLSLAAALALPGTAAAANQRVYPARLPADIAHPGSAIVAFKTPVTAAGDRLAASPSGNAGASDIAALNSALASIGATGVRHLFTNVPADQLAAARARAQAATGRVVTDFTQVYQVTYDPKVAACPAANPLALSPIVSAAMPDWIFKGPKDPAKLSMAGRRAALKAAARARAADHPHPSDVASLPRNEPYRSDAQSYQDAASDNVTGAAQMLAKRFRQQPAQGEVVTNISLGNVDNRSTVLQNGQRFIVQSGYPKIPVWLSQSDCVDNGDGTQTCTVALDPSGTTGDDQGDFTEVDLDFSVMAPPPLGDPRVPNPAVGHNSQLLGSAYGASFRLINPKENNTENFRAAWLGARFLLTQKSNTITASIGQGFSIGGFSDYFFENEAIIHDVVTELVQGQDIFVSISAGDGQTETSVAMNPNGLTGPTEVTTDPDVPVDIDDPDLWLNPRFSYGLTVEPQFVIDSGSNDAAANTLNDVYNNSPFNSRIDPSVSHSQHTTETRWTGQQNFHTGFGSRANVSAPGDDILIMAQIEDANGQPVDPVSSFPRLIGGSSASAPEVAGAAAVVRQTARLLGISLSATQIRSLLFATGHKNIAPAFDLSNANIGRTLDLTAAVQALFDHAHANGSPSFARMTVAQRKAVLTPTDFRSSFWSDTPQDPRRGTASIDLSQGLVSEIFALLGEPVTSRFDRVVTVTAASGRAAISTDVTFKGQRDASYSHAIPPSFDPVFVNGDSVRFAYDLRGLRGADGGILIVSDIDRAVPQAFPDNDLDAHGKKYRLNGLVGSITLSAREFPHGVGTYGIALRGTRHGAEIADSTSFWQPLRFAPTRQQLPATPKVQAAASALGSSEPLFYDVADIEPGGSSLFGVTYDVRSVTGARNAIVEFSRPTRDFAEALFISAAFTPANAFVNNFTNPNGDRLDSGNDFGQPGETAHAAVAGTNGFAVLDGAKIGLSIPPGSCDSTYQVRVLATDAAGRVVGVAGNGSILSYADFSDGGPCFS